MAQDPSAGVQPEMLPHLHLVSAIKYPHIGQTDLPRITNILSEAARMAKTPQGAFFWTYLDKPDDGSAIVTWQPFSRVGGQFATDGYIWASPEMFYKQDLGNGLTLEVYYYKSGYNPMLEKVTLHSRKRYRLVASPGAPPSHIQSDPSLFLVHYGPADPPDRIPITSIPYEERIQILMTSRANCMRLGSVPRKDFLLGDRNNWPQVTLPRDGRPSFVPNTPQRGVPQQMAFPAHPVAAPPNKRARHSTGVVAPPPLVAQQPPPPPPPEVVMAEEEDNFRGDFLDHITPRELAMLRYQNNHEWMEQITASPYPLSSIIAPELGFGRSGPFKEITDGFFTAQGSEILRGVSSDEEALSKPIDAEKAAEFKKRVEEHIAASKAEMEKMAKDHAEAMAVSKSNREVMKLERELRTATFSEGTDSWSVNGGYVQENEEPVKRGAVSVDEVLKSFEEKVGGKVVTKATVTRVQAGGYQAPVPREAIAAPSDDVEMGDVEGRPEGGSMGGEPEPEGLMMGDMNEAGEALAGYGDGMEMEESAFGDAFHGVNA